MKKNISLLLILVLVLSLSLCAGCKKEDAATDNNSSALPEEPAQDERPRGEALLEEELPYEKYIYEDGFYTFGKDFPTLDFGEAKGYHGDITINIIGDSISEGAQAKAIYNNGYPALFKNSLNKTIDSKNWGFVIPFGTNGNGDKDLHMFYAESGGWLRETHSPSTPGFVCYRSGDAAGSTAVIELDRRAEGVDRNINGFYLYYSSGPTYGGFDVYVNDTKVYSVAGKGKLNLMARTEYIAIPDGTRNNFKIRVQKTDSEMVSINGVCYAEKDGGVFVNTYACSGMTACEVNNSLLKDMCKANYVIFALGYNDVGKDDPVTYAQKLQVVVDACKESGATLICLDFMWNPSNASTSWGQDIKSAMFDAAKNANGYYIDFTYLIKVDRDFVLADAAHPTPKGYKLVARKLCYFFGIPFSSIL